MFTMNSLLPETYFKSLSDETRLRCLMLLYKEGELCVCELTAALELSQPKISRHLAPLRHNGILQDSRVGQWVYYKINPDLPVWTFAVLAAAEQGTANHLIYQQDYARLKNMSDRPQKNCH
jgi:ArsR family transcriptional regulator, arsenate/arsenite/antimonite-responsive transcriptional repressor